MYAGMGRIGTATPFHRHPRTEKTSRGCLDFSLPKSFFLLRSGQAHLEARLRSCLGTKFLFDIAVIQPVASIAQETVSQFVAEQSDGPSA
jgi:hypothetical protein